MPKIAKPDNIIYQGCQHGKLTKFKFPMKESSTTKPLELIHTDLCRPMRTKSFQGERYFLLLIDDYNRMEYVTFLREKAK